MNTAERNDILDAPTIVCRGCGVPAAMGTLSPTSLCPTCEPPKSDVRASMPNYEPHIRRLCKEFRLSVEQCEAMLAVASDNTLARHAEIGRLVERIVESAKDLTIQAYGGDFDASTPEESASEAFIETALGALAAKLEAQVSR